MNLLDFNFSASSTFSCTQIACNRNLLSQPTLNNKKKPFLELKHFSHKTTHHTTSDISQQSSVVSHISENLQFTVYSRVGRIFECGAIWVDWKFPQRQAEAIDHQRSLQEKIKNSYPNSLFFSFSPHPRSKSTPHKASTLHRWYWTSRVLEVESSTMMSSCAVKSKANEMRR